MSATLRIVRAGPSTTVQDVGRFGMLQHGISESGPMDRHAFERAGAMFPSSGADAIEFTRAGLTFAVSGGAVRAAFAGGEFRLAFNDAPHPWPTLLTLNAGDAVDVTPGPAGNYGYVRFDHDFALPPVLGSRATNLIAGLGGLAGRALRVGDELALTAATAPPHPPGGTLMATAEGPIRFIWGIHADLFAPSVRQAFVAGPFAVSTHLDRMGVRLIDSTGVFAAAPVLSLVSDAIVAGDIQILGDGTPIVLMRDHQPTGGYPRIGTIVTADLDRFAQMRPGTELAFAPITLQKARDLLFASPRP